MDDPVIKMNELRRYLIFIIIIQNSLKGTAERKS